MHGQQNIKKIKKCISKNIIVIYTRVGKTCDMHMWTRSGIYPCIHGTSSNYFFSGC